MHWLFLVCEARKYSLYITSTSPCIFKWHMPLTPPSGCCSRYQDSLDQTNIYAATVHNKGRIFHVLTWKGMVRLIFSPTFLMYFVLSSRGRRIFGCSKAEGSSLLKYTVILLGTSLSTVETQLQKEDECKMNMFFDLCLSQTHPWSHGWWRAVTSRQEGCVQRCLLLLPWSWPFLPQADHAPHSPASRKAHCLPPPTQYLESYIK